MRLQNFMRQGSPISPECTRHKRATISLEKDTLYRLLSPPSAHNLRLALTAAGKSPKGQIENAPRSDYADTNVVVRDEARNETFRLGPRDRGSASLRNIETRIHSERPNYKTRIIPRVVSDIKRRKYFPSLALSQLPPRIQSDPPLPPPHPSLLRHRRKIIMRKHRTGKRNRAKVKRIVNVADRKSRARAVLSKHLRESPRRNR